MPYRPYTDLFMTNTFYLVVDNSKNENLRLSKLEVIFNPILT